MERAVRRVRRKRRKRRTRLLLVSVVVAGGVGWVLGSTSERTAEEVLEEERAAKADAQISREVNRMLLELWRMEDVEYLRNRR